LADISKFYPRQKTQNTINDDGRQAAHKKQRKYTLVESRHTTFYTRVMKVYYLSTHKKTFQKNTKLTGTVPFKITESKNPTTYDLGNSGSNCIFMIRLWWLKGQCL
jgi:hypothetical protein